MKMSLKENFISPFNLLFPRTLTIWNHKLYGHIKYTGTHVIKETICSLLLDFTSLEPESPCEIKIYDERPVFG